MYRFTTSSFFFLTPAKIVIPYRPHSRTSPEVFALLAIKSAAIVAPPPTHLPLSVWWLDHDAAMVFARFVSATHASLSLSSCSHCASSLPAPVSWRHTTSVECLAVAVTASHDVLLLTLFAPLNAANLMVSSRFGLIAPRALGSEA